MTSTVKKKFSKTFIKNPYFFLVVGIVQRAYLDNDFEFFESDVYKFYKNFLPLYITEKIENKIKENNQIYLIARNAIMSVIDNFSVQEKKSLKKLLNGDVHCENNKGHRKKRTNL